MLDQLEHAKQNGMPYSEMAEATPYSYATIMRWRRRARNNEPPVRKPGPKKNEGIDLNQLKKDIAALPHGRKRTSQTGDVYQKHRPGISRRDFNNLVRDERAESNRTRQAEMYRIYWHQPGIAWAMDVFEFLPSINMKKVFVCNMNDMCSKYTLPPVVEQKEPCGEEIAGHLDLLFSRFDRPLFIKRDNKGNVNHRSIEHVLEDHMVIPINSPKNYAQYNGCVEQANGDFKSNLRECSYIGKTNDAIPYLVEVVAHRLNHNARRSLKGKNACRVFFDDSRLKLDNRKRKEVFDWIKNFSMELMEKSDYKISGDTAWRIAARNWLQKNNLITITRNGKVLPYFLGKMCHK